MAKFIEQVNKEFQNQFKKDKRFLSFDEYLEELEKKPELHFRNTAQYLFDTFRYFKMEEIDLRKQKINRFKLFNAPFNNTQEGIIIGQEKVQNKIFNILQNFISEGRTNKLILLHGPNGSSKSSIINSIITAMEEYSTTSEGVLYKFNWIFPLKERGKGTLGFHQNSEYEKDLNSYAKLAPEQILSKLHCDVKDPPLFLLTPADRTKLVTNLKEKNKDFANMKLSNYIMEGQLCKKCRQIFEALLASYDGDYKHVLSHIEVERIFISKRYSSGAYTIEPQMHIDARANMITYDKSLSMLPPVLQHMNFYLQSGPLVNASRGILEFSDLLKRPIDAWKYLLSITETSMINLGETTSHLDTLMFGTCNENQLDAFKKSPEFSSFKARMELVRVPYLLEYKREEKIYLNQLRQINSSKHVTPHTTILVALWAVLTRLKKPDPIHYNDKLKPVIEKLTPMDKATIYEHSTFRLEQLTPEEHKELTGNISEIIDEYNSSIFYEGRIGASAREIKNIILNALQNSEYHCLSPFAIFQELQDLTTKTSEYEFLNIENRDGYHDINQFMQTIKNFHLQLIENEILNSIGFYEITDYEEFLAKYIKHATYYVKKEKIKNTSTGISENPDESLMQSFEKQVGKPADKDEFRKDILAAIGAYKLDHPSGKVEYKEVFPVYFKKLQEYNYNQHKSKLKEIYPALEEYLLARTKGENKELHGIAKTTIENLIQKYNYCEQCAPGVLYYYIKTINN